MVKESWLHLEAISHRTLAVALLRELHAEPIRLQGYEQYIGQVYLMTLLGRLRPTW